MARYPQTVLVSCEIPWDDRQNLIEDVFRKDVPVSTGNLAEGHGRTTNRDRQHFVSTARGSVLELETQLQIALNLGYLERDSAVRLLESADEVGRIVNGLLKSLRAILARARFRGHGAGFLRGNDGPDFPVLA